MQIEQTPGIVFKFCRPSGASKNPPSRAMTEALQRLSEAEEMQGFLRKAKTQRRTVVLEVFHSSEGHPLLIHCAAVAKTRA
jgi:hypothetical protein